MPSPLGLLDWKSPTVKGGKVVAFKPKSPHCGINTRPTHVKSKTKKDVPLRRWPPAPVVSSTWNLGAVNVSTRSHKATGIAAIRVLRRSRTPTRSRGQRERHTGSPERLTPKFTVG